MTICTWKNTSRSVISGITMRYKIFMIKSLSTYRFVTICDSWKKTCVVKCSTVICMSLQLTRKNLMAKNMKRLKKQIEREFGKLEAAKYPLSNCASRSIKLLCSKLYLGSMIFQSFATFDLMMAADCYKAVRTCNSLSLDNCRSQ